MDLYMERESRGKYITVKRSKKTSSSTSSSTIKYSRRTSQALGHSIDLPESPPDNKMPSDPLESWLRDAYKFLSPPESYKARPDPATRKLNNNGQTAQCHHIPDSLSLAVSPGTRAHPQSSMPQPYSNDTTVPFVAAAQQLNCTIRNAIVFFDAFEATFRETSDGLRFHAPQDLLNKIWQSQINASTMSPTHDRFQSEPLSFREVQSQVRSRIKAFMTSNVPLLSQAAAHASHNMLRSKKNTGLPLKTTTRSLMKPKRAITPLKP